jgi:pyrroline-5-carboxylate reductase
VVVPVQGEAFLRTLVASSLADQATGPLIDALNTPGGYNQRLRQHMEAAGMGRDLAEGLNKLEG